MKKLGKNSVALILSNSMRNKSYDASYKFKQNNNFYYLTGFDEPNAILVLAPGGMKIKTKDGKSQTVREILFVQKRNPFMEKWDGKRLGSPGVKTELGIEMGMDNSAFDDLMRSKIAKFNSIFLNIAELYDTAGEFREVVIPLINALRVVTSWSQVCDINYIIGVMRSVKLPYELDLMQKAADITAIGLNNVLKGLKPGMYEYQVQSILESAYMDNGSTGIAFDTIVASGGNATTLHYITNREKIKNGSLVLIDTGAEYEHYCADITRTFPANGRFSKEQRVIYDIVLKGNEAGIKMSKAGKKYSNLDKHVKKVMAEELVKYKVIKDVDSIKNFCYHGIGHDLGLDTHDAVPFSDIGNLDYDTFRVGNVTTIEPGLYFPPGTEGFDKKYTGIGIRIEDDVLITAGGNKVLTGGIAKDADEIEKIMNS